jgi:hypothetical protein
VSVSSERRGGEGVRRVFSSLASGGAAAQQGVRDGWVGGWVTSRVSVCDGNARELHTLQGCIRMRASTQKGGGGAIADTLSMAWCDKGLF